MHQKAGRLRRKTFKPKSFSNNGKTYTRSRREGEEEQELIIGGRAYQKALQTRDKYLEMAREMLVAGDRVGAENYFQHADHYIRLINAATEAAPERVERRPHTRSRYYEGGNGEAASEAAAESPVGEGNAEPQPSVREEEADTVLNA